MLLASYNIITVLGPNSIGLLYNFGGKISIIEAYKHEDKRLKSAREVEQYSRG